jgi:hypothetical protein
MGHRIGAAAVVIMVGGGKNRRHGTRLSLCGARFQSRLFRVSRASRETVPRRLARDAERFADDSSA